MDTREIIFLVMQSICILALLAWICVLSVKIRKQEHSYYYIIVRWVKYKDKEPWEWLKKNMFFVYYAIQRLALMFICIGLIEQIRDDSVYQKSPSFFVGTIALAVSVVMTLVEFNNKIKIKN